MGSASQQITTNSSTPVALIVSGTSGTQFVQTSGAVGDELPGIIRNTDATNTVYIGGTTVSSSNGFPLFPKDSLPISFLGTDAQGLYAISGAGTPGVAGLE